MSYQVLARKWRPACFEDIVGQEHVLRALINALDNQRLHHAYLFTGTRGVGKTTLARILARSLNCEEGVSSKPCGVCGACQEISEGRFVDLIEVDAASRTKVDDTRELLDNVQYAPTRGRYKVYLIDEVHMLSTHSFNALLKTLEEPPPHVKFLLATTDPQKLPVTVLSRCLQFNLKRMPEDLIVPHLEKLLTAEQVSFERPALRAIAHAAEGSMRDALSLLDQGIAFGDGAVGEKEIGEMLGSISRTHLHALMSAVAEGDSVTAMTQIAEMASMSPDYEQIIAAMITLLHDLALAQHVPDSLEMQGLDVHELSAIAARMHAEDIQLYYEIAVHARRDLAMVPDPRHGLEMAALRMLAFRPSRGGDLPPQSKKPVLNSAQPPAAHTPRQAAPTSASAPAPRAAAPAVQSATPPVPPVQTQQSAATAPPQATVQPRQETPPPPQSAPGDNRETPPLPDYEPPESAHNAMDFAPAASERPVAAPSPPSPPVEAPAEPALAKYDGGPIVWETVLAEAKMSGMTKAFASHCSLKGIEGGIATLQLAERQESLRSDVLIDKLSKSVTAYLGQELKIKVELIDSKPDSPAEKQRIASEQRQVEAEASIKSDPVINDFQQQLGAVIIPGSIKPEPGS